MLLIYVEFNNLFLNNTTCTVMYIEYFSGKKKKDK